MAEVIYMRVLTRERVMGWRNCEIRYVSHDGNFSDISLEAYMRNITLAPISQRKFNEETRKKR